ncbi:helix-turn-helix transcriptional regulator [Kribbella sp.]|uniref:helix-turn-helix transcriptional regulator n=1 Tax=Kribbella sp. TaxID=1871183 RepID=UPI002D597848|nr:LuxR C-terminal-related transcriptional regulator [Kribbella sp.]HZX04436.1 LuxR C-terminal-related transcriptional regulator [Kribbella sp.]
MTLIGRQHQSGDPRAAGGIPRPPSTLVVRERLHAALDLGARSSLTLLVAPAGTGKTVLLSDWVTRRRASGTPVTWIGGHAASSLERLLEQAMDGDPPAPGLTVVDDGHLLSATILVDLALVLRKSPHSLRIVLATRYDLPLPVPELELKGLALTLRSRDLRFTDAEAAELVKAHAAEATTEDIQLFQARTAGWAAALVLAARAFAASGEVAWSLVNQGPVLDLFVGETVSTLDERVQTMLLSTFGVPSVTGELAAMLSDDSDAPAMLGELAGNGLLVTAYVDGAGGEPVYRYHPLLVELLRRKVAGSAECAGTVAAAQHRSALYYENRGDSVGALRSALGAEDPELVARIVLDRGPELLAAGELDLVAAAFEALPADYLETHPHLTGVRGLMRRVCGDVAGAMMDAAAADRLTDERDAAEPTPDDDALAADAVLLSLWKSRYGWHDVHAAIDRTRSLLALERTAGGRRNDAVLGPERLAWLLIELAATEIWAGDLDSASAHLDEALVSARMAVHARLIAGGLVHRAVVQCIRGQMRNAARSAREALDLCGDELPREYAVRARVALGFAALSDLRRDEARRWYELVAGTEATESDTVIAALRAMLRSALLIEDGRLDEALSELTADPAAVGPLPSFLVRDRALLRFRLAVLIGDEDGAMVQLAELDRVGSGSEAELLRAMLSVRQGDLRATVSMIDSVLVRPGIYPPVASAAVSFRTVLLVRAGDPVAAEASLVDTLNRVAPQRIVHALIPAAGEPVFLDLLREYVVTPNSHPFAAIALERLSGYQSGSTGAGGVTLLAQTRPDLHAVAPRRLSAVVNGARIRLTAREAEVLDQLALGNSYTEIAKALFITENTVKTHLMALYRKLGVEKRSAALRVARGVGLLQPAPVMESQTASATGPPTRAFGGQRRLG